MKSLKTLILFVLIFIFTTCEYISLPEATLENCQTESVTYTQQLKEIIDRNCATSNCHVAGSGVPGNFTTYTSMKPHIADFSWYVIDLKEDPINGMPPDLASDLTPDNLEMDEFNLFKCWIENGSPE